MAKPVTSADGKKVAAFGRNDNLLMSFTIDSKFRGYTHPPQCFQQFYLRFGWGGNLSGLDIHRFYGNVNKTSTLVRKNRNCSGSHQGTKTRRIEWTR